MKWKSPVESLCFHFSLYLCPIATHFTSFYGSTTAARITFCAQRTKSVILVLALDFSQLARRFALAPVIRWEI